MLYKIPVQIENEDPIVLWLSLRQLTIIMIFWWLWYMTFSSLNQSMWNEIALIPALIITWIWILIAIFKQYEMTFVPFVLAVLRYNINFKERYWDMWVDSYNALEIWVIYWSNEKKYDDKISNSDKLEKIKKIEEKLSKI